MTAVATPWIPDGEPITIVSSYRVRCVWCGGFVEPETKAVWYRGGRMTAHSECHEEATA